MRSLRSSAVVAVTVLGLACSSKPPATMTVAAGVSASPPRLAYLCVTPGCDETLTVEIDVHGPRRVAIKRILLSGGGASDFKFTSSEPPPFIVGSNSSFNVEVEYKPLGAPA